MGSPGMTCRSLIILPPCALCLLITGCAPTEDPRLNGSTPAETVIVMSTPDPVTESEMDVFLLLESDQVELTRINQLIDSGIDLNARHPNGMTPLMHAAARVRDPSIIRSMIDAGAEPDARSDLGSTALMIAASLNEDLQIHRALLDAEADIDAKDDAGLTALAIASGDNTNPEVIRLLIDAGSDLESRDRIGMTPIFYAVANNPNPKVTLVLIEAGAGVEIALSNGLTPLMMAAARSTRPLIIELLLNAGADIRRTDAMGRNGMTYLLQNPSLSEADRGATPAGLETMTHASSMFREPSKRRHRRSSRVCLDHIDVLLVHDGELREKSGSALISDSRPLRSHGHSGRSRDIRRSQANT